MARRIVIVKPETRRAVHRALRKTRERVPRPLRHLAGIVANAAARFGEDDGAALAGYMAYSAILSLFPFLIFAFALTGTIIGEGEVRDATLAYLVEVLPDYVAQTLAPVFDEVLGSHPGGILTISALGAIWVASNGIEAVRTAFERAYEVGKSRGFLIRRVIAIGFVFIGTVIFAGLGVIIVLAPLLFEPLEALLGMEMPVGIDAMRYGVGLAVMWAYLWLMHRILPHRAMGRLRIWPGVVFSVVMWMIVATLFSVYLAFAPSYTITYGTLAGVIVTLLFLYLTAVAIIFGAEINAEVNKVPRIVRIKVPSL